MELHDFKKIDSFENSDIGLFEFQEASFLALKNSFPENRTKNLILLAIEKMKSGQDFTAFAGFLDGQPYPELDFSSLESLDEENMLERLSSLPCSLKLTGLQHVDNEIKQLTSEIYQKHGFALTCNMYITPPGNKNCFTYHIDPHKVYIMQLLGTKRWSFPWDNERGQPQFRSELLPLDQGQQFTHTKDLLITPGDTFSISKGLVHRAFHEGPLPSIHLSFAGLESDGYQFLQKMMHKLGQFKEDYLIKIMNDPDISRDKLRLVYAELKSHFDQINVEQEILNFQKSKEREALFLAKFGRPYSEKAKNNFKSLL